MSGLGVLLVVVAAVLVAVVLLPMVVLLDLASGGTGLGLCEGGLGSCRSSYFDAPELAGLLVLVILLLTVVLRALIRLRDTIDEHRTQDATESSRRRIGGT